jgi:hypothetical protein
LLVMYDTQSSITIGDALIFKIDDVARGWLEVDN